MPPRSAPLLVLLTASALTLPAGARDLQGSGMDPTRLPGARLVAAFRPIPLDRAGPWPIP